MFTSIPLKILDNEKVSRFQELEMRISNLEAVLKDLKQELGQIKSEIKEDDLKQIQKIGKYQKAIDAMFSVG